jgi:DNA-binding CsgD family transcriptional regulator
MPHVWGRAPELELLRSFLDEAAQDGGVLLLSGDPGVGKTTLLEAASEAASKGGAEVLSVAGTEFEADLGYSGLHLLLGHLAHRFSASLGLKAQSLSVALGLSAGPPPDRGLVADAALGLLTHCARTRPVLVVVDDLQWLDRASAGVLGIVARRLRGTRVGLLVAHRAGEAGFFDRSGLPQHSIGPVDEPTAAALVRATSPEIAPVVLQRVLEVAEGNPLALVEVPNALDAGQLRGWISLPEVMPLGRRLERLFASRVQALPATTRALLLLASWTRRATSTCSRPHSEMILRGPGPGRGRRPAARRPQRRAPGLQARHRPVHRGRLSTVTERQEAHARLAVVTADTEREAWHRAAAAEGPEESVAALLEAVAHQVLDRGDATGAVTALLRSAALTPEPRRRSQRLAQAASFSTTMSGELRTAAEVMAEIETDPGMDGSLTAAVVASLLLSNAEDGDVPTAHALLARTIDGQGADLDATDDELVEALHQLLRHSLTANSAPLWHSFWNLVARLRPAAPPLLKTVVEATHPLRHSADSIVAFDRLLVDLSTEPDPALMNHVLPAAIAIDRVEPCCPALRAIVAKTRSADGGALVLGFTSLMVLSWQAFLAGRWDECEHCANEGLEIAHAMGFGSALWWLRLGRAAVAAARGDVDTVRQVTDEVIGWAAPRQAGYALELAQFVRSLAAVSVRRFDDAYRECVALTPPGVVLPHSTRTTWFVLDVVESALRTGRHDEAAAHAGALVAAGLATVSPRAAMVVTAAQALTASEDDAGRLFDAAVGVPDGDRWPFERARVQLLYGEHLRRRRSTTDARVQLSDALETFELLQAGPWIERAAAELRATGSHLDSDEHRNRAGLTPQEHEVASLAASGLSNREIAARLLISPRTVGMHLYRVFPKLDITSRAALRDALERQRD